MLLGTCVARDVGGVHETEVDVVLVVIVPVALPKEYAKVCVNEEDAREMVIVPADPIVVAGMETVDLRGIVCRVTVWLLLTLQHHHLAACLSKQQSTGKSAKATTDNNRFHL